MTVEKNMTIEVEKEDLELLVEWGFDLKRNISVYLRDVASELRRCIASKERAKKELETLGVAGNNLNC